jgi:nicotinate phosphoribosyltransferase
LATSADAPSLAVVYKLVETEDSRGLRYHIKLSQDKETLPGAKQVFRFAEHDLLGRANECPDSASPCEALLRPVIIGGRLVEPLPDVHQARAHAAEALAKLPAPCVSLFEEPRQEVWRVERSSALSRLFEEVRHERGVF